MPCREVVLLKGEIVSKDTKKLTLAAFILMMLTSVFGVTNIGIGFYRMGYAAIPMFIGGGILFFVPFLLMMIEFGTGFSNKEGGIYSWMKESVSPRFGFYGIFMWYSSYIIWMFGKALNLWTPLSVAILGEDITATANPLVLSALAVVLILVISALLKLGPNKFSKIASIGGLAVVSLNVILIFGGIIAFIMNGGELSQPLTAASLTSSPNPDFHSILPFLGFVVFAVFAFGGTEAMAGIADDLENPERDLKRGIFISGAFIIFCYVIGFLMVGAIMNWSDFPETVNSLSALYTIMYELGNTIGGDVMGQILMRFAGLGMFLSFLGALITLMYAPLKQLIEATPKEIWPASFQEKNENGIMINAVKAQATIVIVFIVVKAVAGIFNAEGAKALFESIMTMTNVAMTLPYCFLIIAWYKYRKNDALEKGLILIKSQGAVTAFSIITFVVVMFGNVFTIITPFIDGDINGGIWTIAGPIVFSLIGSVIYNRSNK